MGIQQKFVNRKDELAFLEEHYKSGKPELMILYGRRRVGKTELLSRFCKNKKGAVFYVGFEANTKEQVGKFAEMAASALNDGVFTSLKPDWELMFEAIKKRKERTVVVIDEYPFIVNAEPTTSSRFLRIWETILKDSSIFLVLCGSSVSMMEKETLAYKSPLYGRRTGQWLLKPFKFSVLKEFFPEKDWEELVEIYSIAGGVPFYLQYFAGRTPREVMRDELFSTGQVLHGDAEMLLKEELREPVTYFTILKSLSFGNTKLSEIANETGIVRTHLSKYLRVLQNLGLVTREVSITEKNPQKSRLGLYFISDNYLRFWFKFVFPNGSEIETNREALIEGILGKNEFNSFVGASFENACREVVKEYCIRNGMALGKLGRWWDAKNEIDLIGIGKDAVLFVECKWSALSRQEAGRLLQELKKKAETVKLNKEDSGGRKRFMIIAKSIEQKGMLAGDDDGSEIFLD